MDKDQCFGLLSAATVGAAGSPERAYLTQHQDVAGSVVAGTFASGLDHYLRSGYGRLIAQGANPTFIFGSVGGNYLRADLDVAAVAAGTAALGLAYFFRTGIQKDQSWTPVGVPLTDAERQALRRERVAAKRASLARKLFLAKDRQVWAAVEQVARELMRL